MSASFYDLLKFAKTGIAAPHMTAYDKQKALAMCKSGFPVKTLTGVPPIPFDSDGTPLTAWTVVGNMTQTGTPTPSAPITPTECGDLVESGEHAGQYAIPITVGGQTQTIYLSEPLRKIGDYSDTVEQDGTVTRRIKKRALTGQETCVNYTYSGTNGVQVQNVLGYAHKRADGMCSIYPVRTTAGTIHCLWIGSGGGDRNIYFVSILDDMSLSDASDFKTYLSTQYASGTPVCLWHVLSTPTTETVTVPTLTPTKGSNTLSIGTTLQPSSVSITGGIK